MFRRDYIERLIEECARVLSRAMELRRGRQLEPALRLTQQAEEQLVGPLRPVLERLEPSSAVEVAGPAQLDRVRIYASLVGEEGLIYQAMQNTASAFLCLRRSLELYAAVSLARVQLDQAELERITVLMSSFDAGQLDERYRDELQRLAARGGRRSN
ncbi:MAG: hypothetical protein M3Z97_15035 [Candidatus Dormibacteraeota bacterium]|nr:hypothetical protein [Candidatus Dormibacteraeota bacterium]